MQKHRELAHPAERMRKCIFCGLYFRSVKAHLHGAHKSQLRSAFTCTYSSYKCTRYFLTEAERDKHVATVHKQCLIKCIYCGLVFSDNGALMSRL